jgi:hypothetical protein
MNWRPKSRVGSSHSQSSRQPLDRLGAGETSKTGKTSGTGKQRSEVSSVIRYLLSVIRKTYELSAMSYELTWHFDQELRANNQEPKLRFQRL